MGCGKQESTKELVTEFTTEFTSEAVTEAITTPTVEESFVAEWDLAKSENQLIVVQSNGNEAVVTMHEKQDGYWKEIMSTTGFVGKNGTGKASENDTKTPVGSYTLSHAFGVKEDPGSAIGYIQVDESHYWVDDPESPYYNQFVSTKEIDRNQWKSAEHLVEYEEQYAYAVAIDYNLDCVPGEGSAIFLHCSNGKPTYGCVAIPEQDMIFVLQHLKKDCRIVIF